MSLFVRTRHSAPCAPFFRRSAGVLLCLLLAVPAMATEVPLPPARPQSLAPASPKGPLLKFQHAFSVGTQHFELELYAASEQEADQLIQKLGASLQKHQEMLDQAHQVLTQARSGTVRVSPELYALLDKLRSVCQLSQGAFDPTDQPLRELWGFVPDVLAYHLPRPEEIKVARQRVNCGQIELSPVPPTLFLANPLLQLNWELFRTGWLLDQSLKLLNSQSAAMLKSEELAYYHGAPPDAPAWKVPVPNPRDPETPFSYLYLKNQALMILGDYQNYFLHNGIRYSSLLDARTGYPNQENVAVQVIAASALDAELIAHASAALDDAGTRQLLKSLQRSNIYKIVDRNGLLVPLSY